MHLVDHRLTGLQPVQHPGLRPVRVSGVEQVLHTAVRGAFPAGGRVTDQDSEQARRMLSTPEPGVRLRSGGVAEQGQERGQDRRRVRAG